VFHTVVMETLMRARALVVGGTGGLGQAITARLSADGAQVVTVSRDAAEVPGAVGHIVGDVTVAADRDRMIDESAAILGGLDVVILASGVVGFAPAATQRSDDLAALIDADLTGPLALLGLASAAVDDGGAIVVITGAIVDGPIPGTSAYAAAKAGLSSAAKVVAREVRPRGITVIDARPPHTETGLASRAVFGEAPAFRTGAAPAAVADRIVAAVLASERELPPSSFGS
jgi:cyclic-di-GMP-binding biofilm dispersal mediator protein